MCTGGLAVARAEPMFVAPAVLCGPHRCGCPQTTVCQFSAEHIAAAHKEVEKIATKNTESYASLDSDKPRTPPASPVADAAQQRAPAAEPVTHFSSVFVPALSLLELGAAMQRTTACSDEDLLMTLALIARYSRTANVPVTRHMMHRLYVACLHQIIKTHRDRYPRNDTFAICAGISLAEMNALEIALLDALQWRCLITADDVMPMLTKPRDVLAALPTAPSKSAPQPSSPGTRRSAASPPRVAAGRSACAYVHNHHLTNNSAAPAAAPAAERQSFLSHTVAGSAVAASRLAATWRDARLPHAPHVPK